VPYVEERLARIEAYLGLPPYDPNNPGGGGGGTPLPSTPTFFRITENSNHSVTATWSGSSPTYEVHEFLANPSNTLQATVTSTTRTSAPLIVGQTYEFAVRAVEGQYYSPFSERMRITIGSGTGGEPGGGTGGELVKTYRYYKFTPVLLRNGSTANSVQLAEFAILNGANRQTGMTITASNNNSPVGQEPDKAGDNSLSTKWLSFNKTNSELIYDFGVPTDATGYRWATAEDAPERDPLSWNVSASVNGTDWIVIDSRITYATPSARNTYLSDFDWNDGITTPGPGGGGTGGGGSQFLGVGGVATPPGAIISTGNQGALTISSGGTASSPKVYDGAGYDVGRITINAPYVTVQNFKINANGQYGVVINNSAHYATIQNCDIRNIHGPGDLNCFTVFANHWKIKFTTAINPVTGDPGGSHTDWIQTWVSSSHPNASSDNEVIGNRAVGPHNPSRNNSVASIHQIIMVESAGRGGNSGGSGTPSNWLILDNEFAASWGQDIKTDYGDNFIFARNKFTGSSDRVFGPLGGTGNKVYSSNTFSSQYKSIGATITQGDGPPTPPQGSAPGTTNPTPDPGTGGTTSGAPGQKFNLSRWYVTLPIAATDGSDTSGPWDIYNPRLTTFIHPRYFYLDSNGNLKLEAPVKGVTTSSASGATRDEFREEEGSNHAAWNAASANRTLTVTNKVDPSNIDGRKEAITGQIHASGGTPPVYLAVNHNSVNGTLSLFKNGPSAGTLITGLSPSDIYTYRIRVRAGRCQIWAAKGDVTALPATPQFDFPVSDFNETTGCYFKAGIYNKQDIASATTGSTFGTIYRIDLEVIA
jgi:hypothetical protein